MDGHAGNLAGGVQAGNHGVVVLQDLGADVGGDAAHGVVRRREYRHRLGVRLHTEVGAGEFGDVRELGINVRRLQVGQVQEDVVLVRAAAAAFTDFVGHGAGHDVTRCQVLDGGGVALHEALTF